MITCYLVTFFYERRKVMNKIHFMSVLSILVVLLSACSSGNTAVISPSNNSNVNAVDSNEVSISGFSFKPAELTVKIGATVTWTNQDSATHDVRAADSSWGSEALTKGQSFSMTFDKEGTYEYVCSFHSGMNGKVIVTK